MQVKYRLVLGQDEFELNLDVKDEKDFFQQVSFYSNLPKTAPGGSTDLKIVFRTTKKGHKYYSLISEKEKKEFKLGQNTDANGGGLFPKGWDDLYEGEDSRQDEGQSQHQQSSAPIIVGAQSAPAPKAAPVQAPVIQQFVAPQVVAAPQQFVAPVAAPTPAAAAPVPAANPNVTAVANNVLARFGINK